MSINNFKRLEEEEEVGRGHSPLPPRVGRNVRGNIGLIEFIGNIVELYLPKVFEMFSSISGAPDQGADNLPKSNQGAPGEIDPSDDDDDEHGGAVSDDIYQ